MAKSQAIGASTTIISTMEASDFLCCTRHLCDIDTKARVTGYIFSIKVCTITSSTRSGRRRVENETFAVAAISRRYRSGLHCPASCIALGHK